MGRDDAARVRYEASRTLAGRRPGPSLVGAPDPRPDRARIPPNSVFAGFIAWPGDQGGMATWRVRVLRGPTAEGLTFGPRAVLHGAPGPRLAMLVRRRHRFPLRALVALAVVASVLLGSELTAPSSGDLQSQIDASRSAAAGLQQTIAADTAQINRTTGGLQAAEQRLSSLQSELSAREAELRKVQGELVAARDR